MWVGLALSPSVLLSQTPRAGSQDSATGPSMTETRNWVRRALPELGRAVSTYTRRDGQVLRTTHETSFADIVNFRLLLTSSSFSLNGRPKVEGSHAIPLAAVDLSRLAAYRGSDSQEDSTDSYVLVQAQVGTRPCEYRSSGAELRFGAMVQIWAKDAESALRVLSAVRRAAVLCGAHPNPF